MNTNTKNLTGIGGWLILVAIRIVFKIVILLFFIIYAIKEVALSGVLESLSSENSPYYVPGFFVVYWAEVVINIAFLLVFCYLAYLFFTKNYKTPKVFITAEIAYLIFLIVDGVLSSIMFDFGTDSETVKDVIKTVVGCCIWVPYFLKSVRVKNTFTKGRPICNSNDTQSTLVS